MCVTVTERSGEKKNLELRRDNKTSKRIVPSKKITLDTTLMEWKSGQYFPLISSSKDYFF